MNKVKISFLITLACTLFKSLLFAQAPHEINYQGVALNTSGIPIANTNISIRSTIHTGTANGSVVYSEERTVATDATGLFDFKIGSSGASSVTGSLATLNWQVGNKFLEIEMDPAGGTNYVVMGTQQLVSVPYAINAKEAASLTPTAVVDLNNLSTSGVSTNQVMQFNGTNWAAANVVTTPFTLPFAGTDNTVTSFKVTNSLSAGTAIHGKATNTNPNSVGILGEGTGGSSAGVRAINTTGFAVYATGTPTGINPVIYGVSSSSSGSGVRGKSDGASGYGVYGESIAGKGVVGYGNNAGSIGIYGSSLLGIGVKASSFGGTALAVDGNLIISGGNTNPSAGAVLTSDASGNATWKAPTVSIFKAKQSASQSIPSQSWVTINLSEIFDAGLNFNPSSSASDPSTFIAPVTGYYNFNFESDLSISSLSYNIDYTQSRFLVNGVASTLWHPNYGSWSGSATSWASCKANEIIHLNAGDKVKIQLYQSSGNSLTAIMSSCLFEGYLLKAD